MTIRLINVRAKPPRDMIPVCPMSTFRTYWKPGADELGLKLVSQFGVLAINAENKNTDRIPELINELRRLRAWFTDHVPLGEQIFLLASIDNLIKELDLISREEVIDIDIG